MKTIYILMFQYFDRSGFVFVRAYDSREAASIDKHMIERIPGVSGQLDIHEVELLEE